MAKDKFIQTVFEAIDSSNAHALTNLMTDDAVFRFSNIPEIRGRENIRPFLEGFFESIGGISHDSMEVWEIPEGYIMNGRVTYTRHNGTTYPCWFSNTFKMKNGKIKDYLIFVDNSKLYEN